MISLILSVEQAFMPVGQGRLFTKNMKNTKQELLWAINEFPYWGELENELSDPDAKEVFLTFREKVYQMLGEIVFEVRGRNTATLGILSHLKESLNDQELGEVPRLYLEKASKLTESTSRYIHQDLPARYKWSREKWEERIKAVRDLFDYLNEEVKNDD